MYEDVERTPLPDALRRALGKPWAAHIGVKVAVSPVMMAPRMHAGISFCAPLQGYEYKNGVLVKIWPNGGVTRRQRSVMSPGLSSCGRAVTTRIPAASGASVSCLRWPRGLVGCLVHEQCHPWHSVVVGVHVICAPFRLVCTAR